MDDQRVDRAPRFLEEVCGEQEKVRVGLNCWVTSSSVRPIPRFAVDEILIGFFHYIGWRIAEKWFASSSRVIDQNPKKQFVLLPQVFVEVKPENEHGNLTQPAAAIILDNITHVSPQILMGRV